jgi:hypothetical protein
VTTRRPARRCSAISSTAYHEAGHAVVTFLEGRRVTKVTIEPEGNCLGSTEHENFLRDVQDCNGITPHQRVQLLAATRMRLAGEIAQRKAHPRSVRSAHGESDRQDAMRCMELLLDAERLSGRSGSIELLEAYLKVGHLEASLTLERWWFLVERLAAELLGRRTMTGQEVEALLRGVILSPAKPPTHKATRKGESKRRRK